MIRLDNIDVLAGLRTLPDNSVHCCVTSPPYFGLRDYKVAGQIGLEPTPEAFIAKLVEVFREVRRVLHPSGTCWVNMGDSYNSAASNQNGSGLADGRPRQGNVERGRNKQIYGCCKTKDLLGIPWQLAFAMRSDGWWLRQDIIWSKPNRMPESVTDRCTKSHEYIFLLTKAARYFYDAEAVKEKAKDWTCGGPGEGIKETHHYAENNGGNSGLSVLAKKYKDGDMPLSRNRRSVWTIPTQPFSEAHFATFPESLVVPMLLAGTSAKGCCPACLSPWERVVEKSMPPLRKTSARTPDGQHKQVGLSASRFDEPVEYQTTGWAPGCRCDAGEPSPCTICDPFAGSGTTLLVASKLGLDAIGFELSPEYHAMAKRRIYDGAGLFG